MLNGRTVLIVEAEFLVALDIQHLLEDLAAGEMVFARAPREALAMAPRWPELALAIVEIGLDNADATLLVDQLCAAGVGVVLTSTDGARDGRTGGTGLPVIVKPASEADFRAAVARALETDR